MSVSGFGSKDGDSDVCTAVSFGVYPEVSDWVFFSDEVDAALGLSDVDAGYAVLESGFDFGEGKGCVYAGPSGEGGFDAVSGDDDFCPDAVAFSVLFDDSAADGVVFDDWFCGTRMDLDFGPGFCGLPDEFAVEGFAVEDVSVGWDGFGFAVFCGDAGFGYFSGDDFLVCLDEFGEVFFADAFCTAYGDADCGAFFDEEDGESCFRCGFCRDRSSRSSADDEDVVLVVHSSLRRMAPRGQTVRQSLHFGLQRVSSTDK